MKGLPDYVFMKSWLLYRRRLLFRGMAGSIYINGVKLTKYINGSIFSSHFVSSYAERSLNRRNGWIYLPMQKKKVIKQEDEGQPFMMNGIRRRPSGNRGAFLILRQDEYEEIHDEKQATKPKREKREKITYETRRDAFGSS